MAGDLDPWNRLRRLTPSRVGLGRVGDAPGLKDVLAFQFAHAQARDAVHMPLDAPAIAAQLPLASVFVASAAPDRGTFLRRPDLGRQLDPASAARLPPGPCDLVFVIADGLSARAVQDRAAAFVQVALPRLKGWSVGPVVIASQARVALGDEIGERMGAGMSIMLIGERPGLSVADSLGIYLTYAPTRGRRDADRNCISNVHASGLSYEQAADKLAWLISEAMARKLSGVRLKDDVDPATVAAAREGAALSRS
ncbi:Ethanolamine ammonia-lyase light chain [Faunimonas pinastri]|uniref:Ethanolamine ammonia-lyase small subunit n=1 Tax=Faunimonas pinastri TaxID=1855383 RepID=A0A1H9E0K5_9HYPH|nr:ethanolamine ammonia-lyase subunit EutC [Faunimonas pinastri]SEQ19214.1 Ethanolamine ammonia-lyase light chain [Faunimonas pinastri]